MEPPVPPFLLLLALLAASGLTRAQVETPLLDLSGVLPSLSRPANHSLIFHAVMFDAGSTGTRIHVYTFIQKQLPVLDNEMFHSIKPGLSAYADSPEMVTVTLLLKVARRAVPRLDWKRTPLVLRATAGLRLLPAEKAQTLLDQVQHVFDESPFLVPDGSVSIMDGTNEGILAWISLNFLTGHLNANAKKTVGILDLGGGSTQITFLPKLKKTVEKAPVADYVARFDFFNSTFELYSHSYLGNGIMAARLATLGAVGAEGTVLNADLRVFCHRCGHAGYKLCYQEVLKVVKGIIHQPYELKDSNVFFAFSYYFDRAVDAGLIDGVQGGMLQVRDFKKRAKEVCNKTTRYLPVSPFLCMDLTYIACLLKDGFGFKDGAMLQLISWRCLQKESHHWLKKEVQHFRK
uniref:nucleoside diphosphate phosphatase n=1 Tax=Kryptolebias marmoratus TaxID=37003 RepID=A0A3Q2ZD64_KRYMA